ncbi:MAG: hypothetical protein NVSMB6_12660 [Burkholderiaceae bacterium]
MEAMVKKTGIGDYNGSMRGFRRRDAAGAYLPCGPGGAKQLIAPKHRVRFRGPHVCEIQRNVTRRAGFSP